MVLENKQLCADCKGKCCKKAGCRYSTADFATINEDTIQRVLDNGFASIKCWAQLYPFKNTLLYLSTREVNKDCIDLVSISSACALLTDTGCPFDLKHRPSGGVYLIPRDNHDCGYADVSLESIMASWKPYQDLLEYLVVKNTGMPFVERLSEELENYFYENLDLETDPSDTLDWQMLYSAEYRRARRRYYDLNPDQDLLNICRQMRFR